MASIASRDVRLADGSESRRQYYRMLLPWDETTVPVEVLVLENNPLVGVGLMENYLLQAEMRTGGEVSLEPLEPGRKRPLHSRRAFCCHGRRWQKMGNPMPPLSVYAIVL